MKYLASRLAGLFIAVTLLLSSLLGYGTPPALAAVGLTSFEVTPGNNNRELVVTWTTETEVDTVAFRLKRATVQDANAAADVVTLPALGAGVGGSSYEHTDPSLTSGTRYYYWLYEITSSGDVTLLIAADQRNAGSGREQRTPLRRRHQPTSDCHADGPRPQRLPDRHGTPHSQSAATLAMRRQPTRRSPLTHRSATNTPVPTSRGGGAANLPATTDTPQPANTPKPRRRRRPRQTRPTRLRPEFAAGAA